MSWIIERHEGSAGTGRDGIADLTRVFRIHTGNAAARPAWGIAGISINRYDSHPDYATALAIDVRSIPVADQLGVFDVTYTYSSQPFDSGTGDNGGGEGLPGGNDPQTQPDPTLRTPVVEWEEGTRMIPWLKDESDPPKKITNSAMQPFEGLEIEALTSPVTVSFNCAQTVDPVTKELFYKNRLNDDYFSIVPAHAPYPPGYLRCNSWTGSLQYEAGYGWYLAAKVRFEFNPDGWDRTLLDYGTVERKINATMDGYNYVKITDPKTGQQIDGPVPLTNGLRSDEPAVLTFKPYRSVSFTNIFV